MRPRDLSEFSYGYALTEALIQSVPDPLTAAPYFPSLKAEGQAGGGYDVALPFTGELLYLQFKLSDQMERRTARETRDGHFEVPFFRMPLRASSKSDQHAMLMELEGAGHQVFYATPKFHTAKELDEAYLARNVMRQSYFIRPLLIGPLPDDKAHHVSFKPGKPAAYLYSDVPRPLDMAALLEGGAFLRRLSSLKLGTIDEPTLQKTAERMREIILKELLYGPYRWEYEIADFSAKSYEELREELSGLRAKKAAASRGKRTRRAEVRQLELFNEEAEAVEDSFRRLQEDRAAPDQVAYLARTFFGCEVIQIRKK